LTGHVLVILLEANVVEEGSKATGSLFPVKLSPRVKVKLKVDYLVRVENVNQQMVPVAVGVEPRVKGEIVMLETNIASLGTDV